MNKPDFTQIDELIAMVMANETDVRLAGCFVVQTSCFDAIKDMRAYVETLNRTGNELVIKYNKVKAENARLRETLGESE